MGQSLFNITATDDHEKLRTFLRADQNQFDFQCNFKGNFNMHLKRAGPRSEQPVYEPVKFMNMSSNIFNREKTSAATSPSSSCSSNSSRELLTTFTDVLNVNCVINLFYLRMIICSIWHFLYKCTVQSR